MTNQTKKIAGIVAALFLSSEATYAASLKEEVEHTLSTSPDIQIDIREKSARMEEVKQARAGYLPSVDVTAGFGRETSNNPTTRAAGYNDRSLDRGEAAIEVRQNLFDGFATKHETDRQHARVSSAHYATLGSAENLSLRAIEVYLDVMKRRELVEQSQSNLAAHKKIHDQVKALSDSGVGRGSDLDQVSGRLALSRSNVIADESNLDDAKTNYLRVVGKLPDNDMSMPVFPEGKFPASLEDAISRAEANHPVLQSAKSDVDAAVSQYQASRNTFYPRFDLELGKSWNNNIDGVEGTNEDTTAMIRMRYNLLKGGADMARKEQTAQLAEESRAVMDRTRLQVIESVRLSWNAYTAISNQIGYLKNHYDASTKTRDAYSKQFGIGKRTLLDLLDTENELFESRRAYINAKYDRLFAQYRIMEGMGMLNETLEVSVTTASR